MKQTQIRNIAIIAHVDHGKTTLVDHLLKQANTFEAHEQEMQQETIMDSQDLERERGVTILAKNTAIEWNDYKINILDTPGHADFSGEVERVLTMAEGCVLLVDASEGVLSQTRFVLRLALELHLTPIVIINKVDRKDQRADEVLSEIHDLFLDLASDEDQLDFPVLYAVGRDGIAGEQVTAQDDGSLVVTDSKDLKPLFSTIIDTVPAPKGDLDGEFMMQVTTLDYDSHKGRFSIGKINRGQVKQGQALARMDEDTKVGQGRVEHLFVYKGLGRQHVESAFVGDIIAIAGFSDTKIGDTLSSLTKPEGLPKLNIAEPTLKAQFSVSTSPLVGKDGEYTTSRQIEARLKRELETNVGLRLQPGPTGDSFIVSGRGELHLAILIETMRREGYELSVARPEVIFKEIDGKMQEPYERLFIDVPQEYSGSVIAALGQRKAQMLTMDTLKSGVRLEYELATRHLIGFRSELQTLTSGMAVVNSEFVGYKAKGGNLESHRNGAIVASEAGQATAYSLENLWKRGTGFVDPGEVVYKGMVVGLNSRKDDIVMNVCKGKKLTNMRASSSDATVKLAPAMKMSLESSITFLADDELLEVTPKHLRIRKKNLNIKH